MRRPERKRLWLIGMGMCIRRPTFLLQAGVGRYLAPKQSFQYLRKLRLQACRT